MGLFKTIKNTIKGAVKYAAPLVGAYVGGPVGAGIGGAISGLATGGGLKGAVVGAGLGYSLAGGAWPDNVLTKASNVISGIQILNRATGQTQVIAPNDSIPIGWEKVANVPLVIPENVLPAGQVTKLAQKTNQLQQTQAAAKNNAVMVMALAGVAAYLIFKKGR